jgi:hypothetical protein
VPFTVGPMSEAELRLAVTGPVAEAGLAVEPTLVEAVVAELREGAEGALGSGVLLPSRHERAFVGCGERYLQDRGE